MKVSELTDLLKGQDPEATVLVFDHMTSDFENANTISANCVLAVGRWVIVCAQTDSSGDGYSSDQRAAAEYIHSISGIGGGDDPVRFLIASHAALRAKLKEPADVG